MESAGHAAGLLMSALASRPRFDFLRITGTGIVIGGNDSRIEEALDTESTHHQGAEETLKIKTNTANQSTGIHLPVPVPVLLLPVAILTVSGDPATRLRPP
jgi:hypothetical protein